MKKIVLGIIGILLVSLLVLCSYFFFFKENKKEAERILSISDISKNCFSNILIVYNDNTYELIRGAVVNNEDASIKKGTYNYDIDKLIKEVKTYSFDSETGINYNVDIAGDKDYAVSIEEATEVNNFIASLNLDDDVLWCS